MLVFTRKLNESVIISDEIEVKVVSIEKSHIKLGFQAPPSIVIHRKEVYQRIQEENRKATQSRKSGLLRLTQKTQFMNKNFSETN
jgi:carbon storage regulator